MDASGPAKRIAQQAVATASRVAAKAGVGRDPDSLSTPVSLTIAAPEALVRAVWQDPDKLSRIVGDVASIKASGDEVIWNFDVAGESTEVRTTVSESEHEIVFERTDGPDTSPLAQVQTAAAPGDLGTVVSLQLSLPIPGFVSRTAAFAVLYRARALVQTGEIPTLTPLPAARPTAS
jgi:uncharacterized membrane protein